MKNTTSVPQFKATRLSVFKADLLPSGLLCCLIGASAAQAAVLMKPTAATALNYPQALTPEKVKSDPCNLALNAGAISAKLRLIIGTSPPINYE